jgi:lipopolysaccharide biosynthesis regulator YciM
MFQQILQRISATETLTLFFGVISVVFLILALMFLWLYLRNKRMVNIPGMGDNAFFRGIQYLLSNDRDHAIEEFTKSVQVNSDTIETYVTLGNLYRSKGDIERAIRIRQTIILRPNIDEALKMSALVDLGLDYRKGGFLDRALETFLKVLKKEPKNLTALGEVEKIYEEMQDWENAFAVRQKISVLASGDHKHILAHHQTEIGKKYLEQGDTDNAGASFHEAISINKDCVDAYLHLGDLYFDRQDYKNAIKAWKMVVEIAPRFTFLAYRRIEMAYSKMQNLKPVEDFLKECAQFNSDAFTRLALARYMYNEKDYDGALKELESALQIDPAFWEARRFIGEILLSQGRTEDALKAYGELIAHLNVPYLEFRCSNCGFSPLDLQWQCPQCRKWDTINFINANIVDSSPQLDHQRQLTDVSKG